MKILGIIPARFGSTRFPGKPLAMIHGKSMIQRVVKQASAATRLSGVLVATDDQRIYEHVKAFGGEVVMTSSDHQSGTDRCYEALTKHSDDWDAVINIQGDEPYIHPEQIDQLAACFEDESVQLATLVKPMADPSFLVDPNKVKAVVAQNGDALYFSRQALPFRKGQDIADWLSAGPHYLHVGIYGYRTGTLREITKLALSPLEKAESLEQLRWLDHGYRIRTAETSHESHAVDTPADLEKLLREKG